MTTETRPVFIETVYEILQAVRRRSTCLRGQHAAAIFNDDHQILASGYNGAPRGMPHCIDVGCMEVDHHCIRTVHAEINAIIQAARTGVVIKGAAMAVTGEPCQRCSLAIIQAGITQVWYIEGGYYEGHDAGKRTLMAADIRISAFGGELYDIADQLALVEALQDELRMQRETAHRTVQGLSDKIQNLSYEISELQKETGTWSLIKFMFGNRKGGPK